MQGRGTGDDAERRGARPASRLAGGVGSTGARGAAARARAVGRTRCWGGARRARGVRAAGRERRSAGAEPAAGARVLAQQGAAGGPGRHHHRHHVQRHVCPDQSGRDLPGQRGHAADQAQGRARGGDAAGRHLRVRLLDAQLRGAGRAGPGGGPDQAPGRDQEGGLLPHPDQRPDLEGQAPGAALRDRLQGLLRPPGDRQARERGPAAADVGGVRRLRLQGHARRAVRAGDERHRRQLVPAAARPAGGQGARGAQREGGLPPAAGDRRPDPAHRPGPEEAHAEDHQQAPPATSPTGSWPRS